jgi:transaldolase
MIKVPATEAGYDAMEVLVAEGIAVNSTLIFSREQALKSAEAFARGLKRGDRAVDTVISIFVSRFDRALDKKLEAAGLEPSKTGIYNAAAIYDAVEALKVPGCRALFASTGVKGGNLPASYYVEELLAYNTVNTAPIQTIEAFVASQERSGKLPVDPAIIKAYFADMADAGIDFDATVRTLIEEGLSAFKEAFDEIMEELE